MQKMGKRQMVFTLREPLASIPAPLANTPLHLAEAGHKLILTCDAQAENDISEILDNLRANNIRPKAMESRQSSLEEIFIQLVEAA